METSFTVQEAYQAYVTTHLKAQSNPEKTPAVEVYQAYREYVRAFQTGQEALEKICAEATEANEKEAQRAKEEVTAKWQAAFNDYIQAIQKSWADAKPDAIGARALAAIGHSMIGASTSASSI